MRLMVVRGPTPAGPFDLSDGESVAGRSPDCPICLPSKKVSRQHAAFTVRGGRVVVRDLGSHNGILDAHGDRVTELALAPGEQVQVGDFLLMVGETAADLAEVELDDVDEELVLDEPLPRPSTPDPARATGASMPAARPEPPRPPPSERPLAFGARPEAPRPSPGERPLAFGGRPEAPKPPPGERPLAFGGRPEAPRAEAPRADAPRADAPRADAPRADAPRADAPRSDASRADAPRSEPRKPDPPEPVRAEPPRAERAGAARPSPAEAARTPAEAPERPARGLPNLRPRDPRGLPDVPMLHASGPPWFASFLFVVLLAVGSSFVAGLLAVRTVLPPATEKAALAEGWRVADLVAARNADALAAGRLDALDLSVVELGGAVREIRVTDARGTVLAPPEKFRINLATREVYQKAAEAADRRSLEASPTSVELIAPARLKAGGDPVGWVWVDVDPEAVTEAGPSVLQPALLALAGAVGGVLVLVLAGWWLVLRPLGAMAQEAEAILEHNADAVRPTMAVGALARMVRVLNVLAARVREVEQAERQAR